MGLVETVPGTETVPPTYEVVKCDKFQRGTLSDQWDDEAGCMVRAPGECASLLRTDVPRRRGRARGEQGIGYGVLCRFEHVPYEGGNK